MPARGRLGAYTIRTTLVLLAIALLAVPPASARSDVALSARCRSAKARAAGKKAAGLLRAYGRNLKRQRPAALARKASKVRSKFTRAFLKAERKGGCAATGDAEQIESTVDAFVTEVLAATPAGACGNGQADALEECDDGNTVGGDGCSATCKLEDSSALCAGIPTVSGIALDAVLVASGLSSPVHIAAAPLDPGRVFVVEQPGRVRVITDGSLLPTPFLAIEGRVGSGGFEQGLLSIAFHPDYETNGRFFVDYTDANGDTVVARYEVGADPDAADPSSEKILLTIAQPFANHNGGQLAFGPDGFLYVGMGDGGSGGDPLESGQRDDTLLGKLLRLDVDVEGPPYHAVPPTNPNAGAGTPLGLIWAKGLRNPWRFGFDRLTGDLYVGDVGQNQWEEVDFQPGNSSGGENYGWDVFEASHCFDPDPLFTDCPEPPTGFTMPITEYSHSEGCSVTGGFVYRGCRMPDLHGTYFYSDFCSAFIRTFTVSGGTAQKHADRTADLAPGGGLSINAVTSFGEDARGELYLADRDGEIFQIVPGS